MKVLLAKKDYIYYYLEYFYSDIRYVDAGERTEDFIQLAKRMDFEILAVGEFKPLSPNTKILSLEEFANTFFELQIRGCVLDEEQEQLNEYCEMLSGFLKE